MTRRDMLKLYGPGKRRTPHRAFEIAIKKFSELDKHLGELADFGDKSLHWPSWKNCAMCHHAGVKEEGLDCQDSLCVIKGKGLCGRDASDIYEQLILCLRNSEWDRAERYAHAMAAQLMLEYIRYLTKHKRLLK